MIPSGTVASLHLHPAIAGEKFSSVPEIQVEEAKGIVGEPRYFARKSRRQITLIAREQIGEHAAILGLQSIEPGAVRSNIETVAIDLNSLVGRNVEIGEAILFFYEARTPCAKMDLVAPGLRELMGNSRQGVLAQVIRSGRIRVGDKISVPLNG